MCHQKHKTCLWVIKCSPEFPWCCVKYTTPTSTPGPHHLGCCPRLGFQDTLVAGTWISFPDRAQTAQTAAGRQWQVSVWGIAGWENIALFPFKFHAPLLLAERWVSLQNKKIHWHNITSYACSIAVTIAVCTPHNNDSLQCRKKGHSVYIGLLTWQNMPLSRHLTDKDKRTAITDLIRTPVYPDGTNTWPSQTSDRNFGRDGFSSVMVYAIFLAKNSRILSQEIFVVYDN